MRLSGKILILGEICSSVQQCHSESTILLQCLRSGDLQTPSLQWDSGMGSWEQPCVTTFYCNLLSAVMACGTVQTLPWGVYPLNQTQIIEASH